MFTLRYSQRASVKKWDRNTFTDLRPSEADGVQDEIIELAESLNAGPVTLKDINDIDDKSKLGKLPDCLFYRNRPRKGPIVFDWSLDGANKEAWRACRGALDQARLGYPDLQLAKAVHDEYESEGNLRSYPALQLSDWGDEEVTDANRKESADGMASFTVRTILFADPYGAECFNVVELVIKVEVVHGRFLERVP